MGTRERQLEMKVEDNWRQTKCLCELVKWEFILWTRAYPRLVQGHQGFLVPANLACEILGIVCFLRRRFMTFIIFLMGFVNRKFSATAVVTKTLKDFKLGNDTIKCAPRKTGPRWDWGTQWEAETSLGDLLCKGSRDGEAGETVEQGRSTGLW